ncbi:MAG: phage tail protein, partial [Rhodospirillales bacterium CG15_BIG_FIL_POST_REV_8_21_14_020_66_15]
MPISFNAIPIDIRTPGAFIEIDNSAALRGLPGMPSRILVIGQRTAAGTVAEAVPTRVLSADEAEVFFGRGSLLHLMFRALKANNDWTETWAVALDDAVAGTQAAGTITFGGAVTVAGTLNIYIAGQRVRVAVATTDAAADVATNVVAAITAATDLPLTAAVNGITAEQVDLTAVHKGETGNGIDLRVNHYPGEYLPTGLTVAFGAMATGAGNPDLADAIAVLGDQWYTDWIVPYTDSANLVVLEGELADRFGPMVMQDGHAYTGARGTHSTLTTLGNARNSPHLSIIGADASPSAPWAWAAAFGAVAAYYIKIDPARPLQTLPLKGIIAPKVEDQFNLSERNLLLYDAISTFTVDDGGTVRIERAITTYETNAQSIDDASYLDVNTLKTLAYLRYSVRARILQKFPR